VNWEHIFTGFFSPALVSHPSPESKNLLAVDKEGFSLQYFFSHLFLAARYRPFQSSSWTPAGGEGYFPQQFQHSTPTTPLKIAFQSICHKIWTQYLKKFWEIFLDSHCSTLQWIRRSFCDHFFHHFWLI
jgi:hypothetical protein